MLATLILAAAAATSAPVPTRAPSEVAPVETASKPERGPRPTGSTQPFAGSTRPSIGFVSAGTLRDRCQDTAPAPVSYCFAYITGVHDTVQAYETWLRIREFCPPIISAQADMRRAFLTYLKEHPDSASGEAASVIVLALKDQFACTSAEPAKAVGKLAPKP